MLELYQFETCPHCAKVRERFSELGISYVLHNPRLGKKHDGKVVNELTYDELLEGGMDQVPYLVDTDRRVTMYESDDIVEYVEEHYT